jgi:4-hydroxy-3-methylbut-2-enyl diphosphate reductase
MSPGLVCTPLWSERAALWGALAAPVRRTGRGPAHRVDVQVPIAVAGVAGALDSSLRPGDLVVASEIRRSDAVFPSAAAHLMAGALRRLGLPVRLGPIFSAEHVVHGSARTRLAQTGALAVDTESAFLADGVPEGRVVAVRTIVDTPTAPLVHPGTLWRGVLALRALRAAAPVFEQWAAAAGDRAVLIDTTPTIENTLSTAVPPVYGGSGEHDRAQTVLPSPGRPDLVLILGSRHSPDAQQQVARCAAEGIPACVIDEVGALDLGRLSGVRTLLVRTGPDAPDRLAQHLTDALSGLGAVQVHQIVPTDTRFTLGR